MVADVHALPLRAGAEPVSAPVNSAGSVYLDAYLAPLRPWLDRETVTEILVNRPG